MKQILRYMIYIYRGYVRTYIYIYTHDIFLLDDVVGMILGNIPIGMMKFHVYFPTK